MLWPLRWVKKTDSTIRISRMALLPVHSFVLRWPGFAELQVVRVTELSSLLNVDDRGMEDGLPSNIGQN